MVRSQPLRIFFENQPHFVIICVETPHFKLLFRRLIIDHFFYNVNLIISETVSLDDYIRIISKNHEI